MTDISFYHLTKSPLEKALPKLLEKILDKDLRVVIQGKTSDYIQNLNTLLWTYSQREFLPHGTKQDGFSDQQPIYLTTEEENPNNASILIAVEGASPQSFEQYDRFITMFDGNDDDQLTLARQCWSQFKENSQSLAYWQQNDAGAWEEGKA